MATLSITQAHLIINYIVFGCAYLISIGLAGGTQAWTASYFGDDTPEETGYLSCNPLVHIHPVGAIMFLLFYIGFGPIIPINPSNISPQWRDIKLFLVYMSKALMNILLATFSLVTMIAMFGYTSGGHQAPKINILLTETLKYNTIPTNTFFELYPQISSVILVCGMLLLALMFMNTIVASFNFIIHAIYYVGILMLERNTRYVEYLQYAMLFGPLVVLFFFGNTVQMTALQTVLYCSDTIASIFGIG